MTTATATTATKQLIVGFMGENHGRYLKLFVANRFVYGQYSSEVDINWAPEWVDSVDDATDFGGQVEDVIQWIHVFTATTVDRIVKTVELEDWAWEPLTKDELTAKSVAELRKIAKIRGVRGRSRMDKAALVARLFN